MEQFVLQIPRELNDLSRAIEENHFDAARRTAHSMKSTVGYVGLAEQLHPALERIEKSAEAEKNEMMKQDFQYLKERGETALTEVKKHLQQEKL